MRISRPYRRLLNYVAPSTTYTQYLAYFDAATALSRTGPITSAAPPAVQWNDITVSVWIQMDPSSSNTTQYALLGRAGGSSGLSPLLVLSRTSGQKINVIPNHGSLNDAVTSTSNIAAGGTLTHVLASFSVAANKRMLAINGVVEKNEPLTSATAFQIAEGDADESNWVGSAAGGSNKFWGYAADLWIGNIYYDLTVASNIEKFRTSGGAPVNLGTQGQNPTGSQAAIFFSTPTHWSTGVHAGSFNPYDD